MFQYCAGVLCGAVVTFWIVTGEKSVANQCRLYGYTQCTVIGNAEVPETSDPKLRAQLTTFVRQLNREKLK